MADRLRLDDAGRIQSPLPPGRAYLAASSSIKFNRKPLLRLRGAPGLEGVKIYAMDDGLAVEKPLPAFIRQRLDARRQ